MPKKYPFLNAVYFHYDNLAKTAKLALYTVSVAASLVGTAILVKVLLT